MLDRAGQSCRRPGPVFIGAGPHIRVCRVGWWRAVIREADDLAQVRRSSKGYEKMDWLQRMGTSSAEQHMCLLRGRIWAVGLVQCEKLERRRQIAECWPAAASIHFAPPKYNLAPNLKRLMMYLAPLLPS